MEGIETSEEVKEQRLRGLVSTLRGGNWVQVTGRLRKTATVESDGGFCCLGVACEVAIADGLGLDALVLSNGRNGYRYGAPGELASTTCLPSSARKWYGFDSGDPRLLVPQELLDSTDGRLANNWGPEVTFAATALNDDYKLTLAQIGVCFQYTFLREDWEAERG